MLEEGFCAIAPDLAFEIVSPSDPYREVETKVDEYLQAGVQSVRVYRPGCKANELFHNEELSGEDVLPGFSTPIGALYTMNARH